MTTGHPLETIVFVAVDSPSAKVGLNLMGLMLDTNWPILSCLIRGHPLTFLLIGGA